MTSLLISSVNDVDNSSVPIRQNTQYAYENWPWILDLALKMVVVKLSHRIFWSKTWQCFHQKHDVFNCANVKHTFTIDDKSRIFSLWQSDRFSDISRKPIHCTVYFIEYFWNYAMEKECSSVFNWCFSGLQYKKFALSNDFTRTIMMYSYDRRQCQQMSGRYEVVSTFISVWVYATKIIFSSNQWMVWLITRMIRL